MILFTNLVDVKMDSKSYNPIPVLKLTIEKGFNKNKLNKTQKRDLVLLRKEAKQNGFEIKIL